MYSLIFINGAPGVGKSTIATMLQRELDSPYIDFGWLREFHLKRDWSNQSKEEEDMAFENLIFILQNYIKHKYMNIIVTDLRDYRTKEISKWFSKEDYIIFTLTVNDAQVLKNRVLNETRDSGYRDVEKSLAWNKREQERPLLLNEIRLDTSGLSPEYMVKTILNHLKKEN